MIRPDLRQLAHEGMWSYDAWDVAWDIMVRDVPDHQREPVWEALVKLSVMGHPVTIAHALVDVLK